MTLLTEGVCLCSLSNDESNMIRMIPNLTYEILLPWGSKWIEWYKHAWLPRLESKAHQTRASSIRKEKLTVDSDNHLPPIPSHPHFGSLQGLYKKGMGGLVGAANQTMQGLDSVKMRDSSLLPPPEMSRYVAKPRSKSGVAGRCQELAMSCSGFPIVPIDAPACCQTTVRRLLKTRRGMYCCGGRKGRQERTSGKDVRFPPSFAYGMWQLLRVFCTREFVRIVRAAKTSVLVMPLGSW